MSCCVSEETAQTEECTSSISWEKDATSHCPADNRPHACAALQEGSQLTSSAEICVNDGNICEVFEATNGQTCSAVCEAAGLSCLDGWDDNPYNDDNCDHHRIAGVQSGGVVDTRDGNIAEGHPFHNYGAGGCANAYGSQICRCASSAFCEVQSDYPYSWVDITEAGVGTLITDWEQNAVRSPPSKSLAARSKDPLAF